MTWRTRPSSASLAMVRVILGPEPSPPPGPFSQSQRLQPGAMMSFKKTFPRFPPHPLLTMTRQRQELCNSDNEALLRGRRGQGGAGLRREQLVGQGVHERGPLGRFPGVWRGAS